MQLFKLKMLVVAEIALIRQIFGPNSASRN
jgi:hypothetical protein